MAATFCAPQLSALADSANGDLTSDSFAGLLTVTLASEGTESAMNSEEKNVIFLRTCMVFLSNPNLGRNLMFPRLQG
ncbi:MAG: hypothetical protein ABSF53_19230 [Terracidiphilus sp.]